MLNSSFDYKVYTRQFERGISEQIIKSHCHIGLFSHTTYLFIYLFLSLLFWKSPQTITWRMGQLMYSFHVFVFIWQGMMACMFNKGENCIAAGRLFVEASIHDEFVHRVVSLSRMIGSALLHYWGAVVKTLAQPPMWLRLKSCQKSKRLGVASMP